MRNLWLLALFILTPAFAEEIFLTCKVTEIAATEQEGKIDAKLKKILKSIAKNESFTKYRSLKYLGKKSFNATKHKAGTIKLKNGNRLALKVVSVVRAHKQNTITADVTVGENTERQSFIDRHYLLLNAGELKGKGDLVLAISCPVFP
ncbi:MAG: hypothetical protein JSR44_12820 [Spirochaetes bacterium]|nr:hypothetical protein [Spirochaetota bacterium]